MLYWLYTPWQSGRLCAAYTYHLGSIYIYIYTSHSQCGHARSRSRAPAHRGEAPLVCTVVSCCEPSLLRVSLTRCFGLPPPYGLLRVAELWSSTLFSSLFVLFAVRFSYFSLTSEAMTRTHAAIQQVLKTRQGERYSSTEGARSAGVRHVKIGAEVQSLIMLSPFEHRLLLDICRVGLGAAPDPEHSFF